VQLPEGAPDDGFGRTQVWGLNFAVINGAAHIQVAGLRLVGP
jgi:hypothetical protein